MTTTSVWRRPLVGVVALAAGASIALVGCSSDDGDSAASSTAPAASTSATGAEQSGEFTTARAQEILRTAVDPATPEAELGNVAQLDDPATTTAFAAAMKGAAAAGYTPEIYTVSSVTPDGDTATAVVAVASPHAPAPVEMDMSYTKVDGQWKLSADTVDTLIGMTERG